MLEQQGCEYNLFLRGIDNGQVVDEHTHIDIISRCVNPYENFESYMKLAENPDFRFIVSNTTEAGIEYVDSNQFTDAPARSFPGKLTQLLYKRFRLGLKGFIILSCELIDHNGEELENAVCVTRICGGWERNLRHGLYRKMIFAPHWWTVLSPDFPGMNMRSFAGGLVNRTI